MAKYRWIKNKRYYYNETFDTWREAYKMAKYYQKKNGSKYFIEKIECGVFAPKFKYKLYLNKVLRLGVFG